MGGYDTNNKEPNVAKTFLPSNINDEQVFDPATPSSKPAIKPDSYEAEQEDDVKLHDEDENEDDDKQEPFYEQPTFLLPIAAISALCGYFAIDKLRDIRGVKVELERGGNKRWKRRDTSGRLVSRYSEITNVKVTRT